MGNVANVGLMAQKAEEYGSHDKTFEIPAQGVVMVRDNGSGEVYFEHSVKEGDLWRMAQTKDAPIKDWVRLAVERAKATGSRTIFWLATMGNVANVGLMAQKAEEYGSHDKTFEIPAQGVVMVRDNGSGEVYFEHSVKEGDLWRMAQTKDAPIKDWVRLAVERAKATGSRTIFWLDKRRAHDSSLIDKVNVYLKDHDLSGVDISIMKPVDAIRVTMERC
eukprot:272232_1